MDSIMKHGIIPGKNSGFNAKVKHEKVFIAKDPSSILVTMCGERWCRRHQPVVFELNLGGVNVQDVFYHWSGKPTTSTIEWLVDYVEPNRILSVSDYWKHAFHDHDPEFKGIEEIIWESRLLVF
jgi:hypothetical protein